jgi:hypothetical protein
MTRPQDLPGPPRSRRRLRTRTLVALAVAASVALVGSGAYAGRATAPEPRPAGPTWLEMERIARYKLYHEGCNPRVVAFTSNDRATLETDARRFYAFVHAHPGTEGIATIGQLPAMVPLRGIPGVGEWAEVVAYCVPLSAGK